MKTKIIDALDEDSRPVATVGFEYPDEPEVKRAIEAAYERGLRDAELAAANRLFDLFFDTPEMEQVGRRLAMFGFICGFESAPAKSVQALANIFGVSGPRASQLLAAFRSKLEQNAKN